jgi:hypothetical protein
MITRGLLAQSCLFGSSLRFNSLELRVRLEGLRPAKDIEDRFIEGCRYRINIIVSLVRKPCKAYWLRRIHLSLLFSSSRWFWLKFDYEMPISESTNLYSNNTEAG